SIRRVFDTVAGWAQGEESPGLLSPAEEPVLAEAMRPFLQYGWLPQVMGLLGRQKVIRAGELLEVYDVVADPEEAEDLADRSRVDRRLAAAVTEYPAPAPISPEPDSLTEEQRRQLASLGYVASDVAPVVRPDAPVPRQMTHLFEDLDLGSGLFVRQRYAEAIPVFERVLDQDPQNLMVVLRLAAAHSLLGRADAAMEAFRRAQELAPDSLDVQQYLGLHRVRVGEWERAAPLLEAVVAATPHRLPAVEALARVREHQRRPADAIRLLESVVELHPEPAGVLVRLGELHMQMADTPGAIEAFERARRLQGDAFQHHLELGVLYLAAHRLDEARDALDRVPPDHPAYPMALFKRAQVAVLLDEPDRQARIQAARDHADATTGPLIENEALFRGTGI
ncbi:MAG: tetratricopeptide repeat protein, partial [Thermoanaerobaculia bacterium]